MQETRIEDFIQFHQIIEQYDVRTVIYRGIKSTDFPLIPKIGRIVPPDSVGSRERNEQEILRLFRPWRDPGMQARHCLRVRPCSPRPGPMVSAAIGSRARACSRRFRSGGQTCRVSGPASEGRAPCAMVAAGAKAVVVEARQRCDARSCAIA